MSNEQTIVTLAKELSRAFTVGEYNSESTGRARRLLRDASDWMTEVVHAAHGDMMPDDWRYEMIEEVISVIAELEDDADDNDVSDAVMGIEPSIYTSDLTRWLASRNDRYAYCDDAVRDGLLDESAGIIRRIQIGQVMEYAEIGSLVTGALAKHLEAVVTND